MTNKIKLRLKNRIDKLTAIGSFPHQKIQIPFKLHVAGAVFRFRAAAEKEIRTEMAVDRAAGVLVEDKAGKVGQFRL